MENLFMMMMVLLLLLPPSLSAYSRPDKLYLNCGSDTNITYGDRIFIGDKISDGTSSFSLTSKATEATNQSGTTGLYSSLRIFRRTSSYKFRLDSTGLLYFLRLHFSWKKKNLSTPPSFTISATNHFKTFSVHNFTGDTPKVEEFLLMIDSPELEIQFEPAPSSVAFVNAIELFLAPNNTVPSQDVKNLHTVYRLNIGGEMITPDNDTLGRTWSLDDNFLYRKDTAITIRSTQKPNYEGGSLSATEYTAPDFVYQTAKTMNRSSSIGIAGGMMLNVTWSLKVKANTKHFIKFHFCDIKNQSQSPDSDFYLFVNGQWRQDVRPSILSRLVTPFYIDVLNVSDGSGLLNVTIGTKDPLIDAGFLNGLEVMEFLGKTNSVSSNGASFRVYIISGCVAAVFILVLSLLFIVFLKRRRSKKNKNDKNKPDSDEVTVWSPLPLQRGGGSSDSRFYDPVNNSPLRNNLQLGLKILFADIVRATNNFDEQRLIGKGGFGDVYKAILPDGSKAAIKRGKGGSGQGILEFQTEIQVLSRIRHRHLVSLTGYCDENSEMILVYEFMEKGTLKEHLYGSDLPTLTWKQRLEICIGAARGLHYLHSGSEGAIIHRDVKSTNILLDENNVAKVADFGLSKLADQNNNISENIKGTFGYLDPEYMETHILTKKSDVYAFGVVLLEVLCARPALDRLLPHEEVNLAEWFMFCKGKGVIDGILDPNLVGKIKPSSLKKFIEVADKCLKEYGDERPSMGDVIWDLEYVLQLHMMTTITREPFEDSTTGGSSLLIPVMDDYSFTSNSIQVGSRGGTDSSETRVFSQLKVSEAR